MAGRLEPRRGLTYYRSWREWSINEGRVPNAAFLPMSYGRQFLYICLSPKLRIRLVFGRGHKLWSRLRCAFVLLFPRSQPIANSLPLSYRLSAALFLLSHRPPAFVQSISQVFGWALAECGYITGRWSIWRSLDD